MFEFSRFYPNDFERGRDFVEKLDTFLAALPKDGWQYGVEIRNRSFLESDYFEMLKRPGVAHGYNNWTRMPPGRRTDGHRRFHNHRFSTDFCAARFLLKTGPEYQQAVDNFHPYHSTKEINEPARKAGGSLIRRLLDRPVPGKTAKL